MREAETLILMGLQGSGKGTQARLLQQHFGFLVLEAGQMLRDFAKGETPESVKVREILAKGEMVPDEITSRLLGIALKSISPSEHVIIDGYPRTLIQAQKLTRMLEDLKRKDIKVISITLSDEEAIKRLATRKICPRCGKIFANTKLTTCDHCGATLAVRSDATRAATLKRLAWHHDQVEPILDDYKKRYVFFTINGEQSIEKVHEDIVQALKLKSS